MNLNFLSYSRNQLVPLFSAILLFLASNVCAQSDELQFNNLDLSNLNDFEAPAENWEIAGDVFMDLYTDQDVQPESGAGILVNTSRGDNPRDIYTDWEHGDLDLELEFMMAKNSNSGIYFQGRYELQMLDSWGVQNPKFSDMGGVYQWWEDDQGVGGIAPRTNASRAPGLWQHLSAKFRAPKFNDDGVKISHAKLEEVKLNGVVIHRNVNLVHPTGGAVSNEEVATGPLRFQGDHGPVAFRNIQYKKYHNDPVTLTNLTYRYFEGEFETASDIEGSTSEMEGSQELLNLELLKSSGEFAVVYQGELLIEESGKYLFDLRTDGGNQLKINGEVLTETDDENRRWDSDPFTITLEEGFHPIEIVYFRGARGGLPALGLMVEGPGINRHNLHKPGSLPVSRESIPYLVEPVREPILMHGFMDMGDRVHTHTAAVGYPEGINFAFDQNNGSVMKIWKGDFLDASTMWLGRGGGNLSLNEDSAVILGDAPSIALLNETDDAWPDSLQERTNYIFNSYRFEEDGYLTFSYQFDQINIEEQMFPDNDGKELRRTMLFAFNGLAENLFFRIAEGEIIEELPNNLYQINDKTFYIRLDDEIRDQTMIRNSANGQELIVPIQNTDEFSINYSYIW